jgi:two-component system CheB/CheR fusion protein
VTNSTFPIAALGASAGGVEALEGFFRGLPSQPDIGLVLVTHLSPTHESRLPEILTRFTALPVHTAEHGMEVLPNAVYVLSADAVLSIEAGRLQVRKQILGRRERKPIDVFFSALARDRGELAIGIVLSGGDGDGTLGLKAIKERDGLTFAQVSDGFGPGHPDMPNSAIAAGMVDFAIPVEQMGAKLVEFAHGAQLIDGLATESAEERADQTVEQVKFEIYALLRNRVGHDFSGYKTKTFLRRVQRRMQITQLATVEAYVERLRQDPQEVAALFRDLMINVTSFFRDNEAFDSLARLVIPKLFDGRSAEDTVRIWVPGCATGEEVFSIGILLREHMDTLTELPRVQIFATDIDEHALGIARAARYPEALLESVSPERRKRFFIEDGASRVVSKDVRDLCIFSPHSVIRDPPFSRMDLISCRNLLIYFGIDIQNQVIPLFHYALRPDGFLFLGSAESISNFNDLFAPLEKRHRLFRRRSDIAPNLRLPLMITARRTGLAGEKTSARLPRGAVALRQAAEGHVLERYAPPHVVVNGDGDVVHFSARTGKYLEAPAGMPTRQIVTIARKRLRLDLRTLFREAVETGRSVARTGIAVETDDGHVQMVGLKVEPLGTGNGADPLYLILFFDEGGVLTREEADGQSRMSDDVAAHVERELRETRDRLQAMMEEYETALEDLKSSNEELVSVNEEQQSTNEELEASKEELQSVNEELHTVNGELTGKIEALDQANNDLQNLFDSTDVATVFLDKALVIRSFTPAVGRIFNIQPTDRRRPLTHRCSKVALPDFAEDIRRVFSEPTSIERRIETGDKAETYLVRLAPYRDGNHEVQGVVVTFVNVSSLIQAEHRQQILIAELQHRTRNLLALVQSLAMQTFEKGSVLETFSARLAALSRVQGLIGAADGGRVALKEMVDREVQALGSVAAGRVMVRGDGVDLSLEHAQTLGLALHELATNAVKYGALKGEVGQVAVAWTTESHQPGGRRPWC